MNDGTRRVYLLDVEGTVAPLSLVSEQLFPYARKHLADFLEENEGDAAVRADLALLADENRLETGGDFPIVDGKMEDIESAKTYLVWLMDRDRKSTALKSLQGKIWKLGFESGELKGALFADVPAAFRRWASEGRVAIYSSGSVQAQRLLFGHSTDGDLTPLISGYFDTGVGAKGEASSYAAIAAALNVDAGDMMFFSDAVCELDAAHEAGCPTRLVLREGNAAVADAHGHVVVGSFEGL